MKEAKNVYSRNFKEYNLSDEQMKSLQNRLLEAFLDIKKVCDEKGVQYMMAYGTLLGTVRHQGFIPWDEDVDIMMTRKEYEKFKNAFCETLSDRYILAEPVETENYYYKMPKVYIKDTTFITVAGAGLEHYNMLFIDIFIIEYAPQNRLKRFVKGSVYNLAFKAASVCLDYKFPSPIIVEKALHNKEVRAYYRQRRFLGGLFSFFGGINFYLRICETIARNEKPSNLYSIPSSISYTREIVPSEMFDRIGTGMFCGHEVNIPLDYDTYLKNRYGDYMQVPDEEHREAHGALKIEF